MNKNTAITAIVIALILVGGAVYYGTHQSVVMPSDNTSLTPTPVGGNNGSSGSTSRVAGKPAVATRSGAVPADTTVVVSGTVNPNGAFTTYWYEYGESMSLGKKSSSQSVGSGFLNFNAPAYITGLAKSTTYYFRLVAENQYGKVEGDIYSFKTTTGVSSPVGSAPLVKTLSATSVARNSANINGEVTPNQASTEYWFEYGKNNNLGENTAIVSLGGGSTKMSVTSSISDLDPSTTYYFRVNAQNKFGTVNGAIQSFKTNGPPSTQEPTVNTLNAAAVEETSATLRGSVNPNGSATSYWFEYSTDSLLGSVLLTETTHKNLGAGEGLSNIEANISNLESKTTYYFRMVAHNSEGTVRGEKVSFKTK